MFSFVCGRRGIPIPSFCYIHLEIMGQPVLDKYFYFDVLFILFIRFSLALLN